jgi:hypothetical protein
MTSGILATTASGSRWPEAGGAAANRTCNIRATNVFKPGDSRRSGGVPVEGSRNERNTAQTWQTGRAGLDR